LWVRVAQYLVFCVDFVDQFCLLVIVRVKVFNTTFNNISVTIYIVVVLLVEEAGVPGEHH